MPPKSSDVQVSRRSVLAAGAMGLALPSVVARGGEASRTRVLRVAHLTDVHVQPERAGGEGFATALRHVQSQKRPPDLIIFGGDNVMNVDGEGGRERAPVQIGLWNDVLRAECSTPWKAIIGNHDVLALDPLDGKKWAVDAFGRSERYDAFDRAGWRFITLDSTSPEGGGYKGRLDEEQFDWLSRTLRDTPRTTPVCVVSHIPILAACAYFDGDNEQSGDWRVPGAWMHIDARRLKDLFRAHPNVRLCLSGHMHLVDVVEYLGVRYACNGAVSGGWWKGAYHEFNPGYALIDLFDDGSSAVEFVNYEWTPRE